MKKLSSLMVAFVMGSSLVLAMPSALASNPNQLYEQFLKQLQNRADQNEDTSSTPAPVAQPVNQDVQTPVTTQAPAKPLSETMEVRATGTIIEVNPFFLTIDMSRDYVEQSGNYFKQKIAGDNTSWYYKKLRLYSHDPEIIKLIIRAARNQKNSNYVMIGGMGVADKEGILMGISMNEGGYISNLDDPNNPNFDRDPKVDSASGPEYSLHYGYIYIPEKPKYTGLESRAWMKMMDKNGNPILDKNGKQVERILYNQEEGKTKWKSPYVIANVDKNDDKHNYFVQALAFLGESSGGVPFLRFIELDVIRLDDTQVSPGRQPEPAPEPEIAPEPEPAPEPAPQEQVQGQKTAEIPLTVSYDVAGHFPFGNLKIAYATDLGDAFMLEGENSSTNTAFTLISPYGSSAESFGTYAGFNTLWKIDFLGGNEYQLSAGEDGSLPSAEPIRWKLNISF